MEQMTRQNIVQVTMDKLVEVILSYAGVVFGTVCTETQPKMNKGNNPYYGRVIKRSTVNGAFGIVARHYEEKVKREQRRRGLQSDFKMEARKWGVRLMRDGKPTPFVEHNGKLYLTITPIRSACPVFTLDNQQKIDKEVLLPWMDKSKPHLVDVCDYSLENVKMLKIGGTKYAVVK